MEKVSVEMDLDDWEFLPDSGYLDFNQYGGKGRFSNDPKSDPKSVIRPFPTPVPLDLNPVIKDICVVPPVKKDLDLGTIAGDQETVSRVFFKKNEFADMKMDSPKANKGLKLLTETGSVKFEDKEEVYNGDNGDGTMGCKTSPEVKYDHEIKEEKKWEDGLKTWGWKMNGVGALCCIGVAAATTICIIIFGSRRGGNKQQHHNAAAAPKIQFQIHSDDQKIKQVVQHEYILSQAISAARSVPLIGAEIFFGG